MKTFGHFVINHSVENVFLADGDDEFSIPIGDAVYVLLWCRLRVGHIQPEWDRWPGHQVEPVFGCIFAQLILFVWTLRVLGRLFVSDDKRATFGEVYLIRAQLTIIWTG